MAFTTSFSIPQLLSFFIFFSCTSFHIKGATSALPQRNPPPPQQSQIDFFILALTWAPAYCSINKCNPKPPKKQFTVHGFWPQISHGQQTDCSKVSLPSSTFNNERSNLLLLWPDLMDANNNKACKSFWNYEWMKHGSCSHYSAPNYFAEVIELAKTYDILSILKFEGISLGQNYKTQTLIDKIEKHTKAYVQLRCYAIQAGPRLLYQLGEDMDSAYPGSNILVVTLTNGESKRVGAQSDEETLKEAMGVLRDMFGPNIPDTTHILVPLWWNNRFQRGSYSNYPIVSNLQVVHDIKAPIGRIFFTGEHTSAKFNGYVHGGYLLGIDTSKASLEEMRKEKERKSESLSVLLEPLLALTESAVH